MLAVVAAQTDVVLLWLVLVRFVLGMKPDEFLDRLRLGEDADVFNRGEVDVVLFVSMGIWDW